MATLHYKNITVNYSDTGKGKVVVLLHGFLENNDMWHYLIPELSKKYRTIAIDLLGHGQTDCLGYVHSMEDNADVVHAVLSELRIRKVFLAGHSMGGYIALAFAELYPESVKGIALINSTSKADSPERKTNRDRAIKAVKQNYKNFVSLSVANLFNEANRDRLSDQIEHVKREALRTPLQGIVASLEGMKDRKDREIILHEAHFPILLILGKKDGVLNYEDNLLQAENPGVELVIFPDGHMSPIENKEALQETLLAFFKSV